MKRATLFCQETILGALIPTLQHSYRTQLPLLDRDSGETSTTSKTVSPCRGGPLTNGIAPPSSRPPSRQRYADHQMTCLRLQTCCISAPFYHSPHHPPTNPLAISHSPPPSSSSPRINPLPSNPKHSQSNAYSQSNPAPSTRPAFHLFPTIQDDADSNHR